MHEDLLQELGALPSWELEEASDEQIRRRARQVFIDAEASLPPWASVLAAAWRSTLEPPLVTSLSGVFLGWALKKTIELLS